jgi:hypothetical protein
MSARRGRATSAPTAAHASRFLSPVSRSARPARRPSSRRAPWTRSSASSTSPSRRSAPPRTCAGSGR